MKTNLLKPAAVAIIILIVIGAAALLYRMLQIVQTPKEVKFLMVGISITPLFVIAIFAIKDLYRKQ